MQATGETGKKRDWATIVCAFVVGGGLAWGGYVLHGSPRWYLSGLGTLMLVASLGVLGGAIRDSLPDHLRPDVPDDDGHARLPRWLAVPALVFLVVVFCCGGVFMLAWYVDPTFMNPVDGPPRGWTLLFLTAIGVGCLGFAAYIVWQISRLLRGMPHRLNVR